MTEDGETRTVPVELATATVEVPDVVGLTVSAAVQRLRSAGLTVEQRELGCEGDQVCTPDVVATTPGAGDQVPVGASVRVTYY